MVNSTEFDSIADKLLQLIYAETGCPVVIYDTTGYIIKATDTSRVGTLHPGAEKIMKSSCSEYGVTREEAERNPLVKEGYSIAIIDDGRIIGGFGITGCLELASPLAKIAAKIIEAWIIEQKYKNKIASSDKKYRSIFNRSLNGIFQTSISGQFLAANQALALILGWDSPEELIGALTDISRQLYADAKDREKLLTELQDKGAVTEFYTKFKRRNGELIDVKLTGSILKNDETGESYVEGMVEDITERKKTEEALRLSEEKFFKAFNNCPVSIVITLLETGEYLEVNETFLETMGHRRSDVIGNTSVDIDSWVNPDDRLTIVDEVSRKGKMNGIEVQRKTSSGEILDTMIWGELIEIAGKACMIVVSLNISEKKEAEREREKLEKALAQSQKMDAIGKLAGGVAHDFNNMLGGMIGAAEMLSSYLPDDPYAEKFHRIILETADRSAGLVSKLLAFSRDETQVLSVVDVHEIIKETIILLANAIDKKITIETHLEAESSRVMGDHSQLENVFLNMGINSSHAMPDGGKITISSDTLELDSAFCEASLFKLTPGRYLEVKVRDEGAGIAPEYIDKIFDPFFTTKKKGKGTGLGLSAVYGSIRQHKGAVSVDSRVGEGTTFQVLLPITGLKPPKKRPDRATIKGEGRILVVDDEIIMRTIAKATLESLGYEVLLAENGREALDIVRDESNAIDLILLDLVMPVMGGKDCYRELKVYDPKIPVVITSGFTSKKALADLKTQGIDVVLKKPFTSAILSRVIHDVLKRK